MFREIRARERITDRTEDKKEYGYMQIKPETDITVEEANAYIRSIFEGLAEEN